MTEVCLIGADFETDNRGVSALAAGACKLIDEKLGPAHITVLVYARKTPPYRLVMGANGTMRVDIINCGLSLRGNLSRNVLVALVYAIVARLSPSKRLRQRVIATIPLLHALDDADLVGDLFGGDSFTDSYGLPRFVMLCILRWCALLLRKRYVLLPQTYGPFRSTIGRSLAGLMIRRASLVFTRTEHDAYLRQWESVLGFAPHYCPDAAFAVVPDRSIAAMVRSGRERDTVIVGINVSGLLYNGGYTRQNMFGLRIDYKQFVIDLVSAFVAMPAVCPVLVPHTYNVEDRTDVENDLAACLDVAARIDADGDQLLVIQEDLDQHEIKGAIGACDFFVGSRLHSCIAALSQGVVTVGVAYSKKFTELFSTLGMEDLVIDGRLIDTSSALSETLSGFRNRRTYAPRLQSALQHQTAGYSKAFELIRHTLPNSRASVIDRSFDHQRRIIADFQNESHG